MINEKKIKEAADKYCAHLFSETIPRPCRQSWSGDTIIFKAGIDWFKANLWHDVLQRPKANKLILVECFIGTTNVTQYKVLATNYYIYDVETYRIQRWLYIDDLLKEDDLC